MILSFADKETEKIWNGDASRRLPIQIQQIARRKLRMINNSVSLNDLRVPPANRLKKLAGELNEYHSIRINDQCRIIFVWRDSHAHNVSIVDYH